MNDKIRVLHVVTHMNRGGLETMIMNYYRNIDRSKIQFDFLTHREYDGDYGDEIKKMGGIIYHLPKLNPFSIFYRRSLDSFFREHPEYRIIHVHQDCMSSLILKYAKKNEIKVRIAHSHNSDQDHNLKYILKLFYKRSIRKYATDLFACSKSAGNWMFNGADFKILNNAINAGKFTYNSEKRNELRRVFNIKPDELVIGNVGRFSYTKNHSFLTEIFYEIQKKKQAKLLLVGEGELRKSIEKKVKELNIESKVEFLGLRSDVNDIMQAMDIFVFPSVYEGLPLTLVEAQASGLPCFISDAVPGECKMTDMVYQIPLSKNAAEWCEVILRHTDYERKNTYSEIVNSGYDIEKNAVWLMEYYKNKFRIL